MRRDFRGCMNLFEENPSCVVQSHSNSGYKISKFIESESCLTANLLFKHFEFSLKFDLDCAISKKSTIHLLPLYPPYTNHALLISYFSGRTSNCYNLKFVKSQIYIFKHNKVQTFLK